jgi:hypothetical protein
MSTIRKLPIGIQDFEKLRNEEYVYVDKTEYIYQLTRLSCPYFLGRPRRFGKSLFISTLKAYFLGKKELFDGLAIAELEKEWTEYPVIHIDFNVGIITDNASLNRRLSVILTNLEKQWGRTVEDNDPATRFEAVIQQACIQTGRKVVVLVDEYDKPLVNTLENKETNETMRYTLKGFYGVLKSVDACLRFVFLTGVTKFSQISVFSDLNHLVDISMEKQYTGICGISESELTACFQPEIQALADELGKNYTATLFELKRHYNGYHFCENTEGIYNPFSLLNTFRKRNVKNYWFKTGTPTFLVKMLKDLEFDIKCFENDMEIPADSITDYRAEYEDPVPLLYQSGYLTIKDYNAMLDLYILGFPNEEVKYSFLNELLPIYMPTKKVAREFYAANFVQDLLRDNVDGFMTRMKAFFAGIPYDLNNKTEKHFQTVFFVLFQLMGQFVEVEQHSATGRADAVVITNNTVFVFEFKITDNSTVEKALQQIDDKGYMTPYIAGDKKLVKIGVEFSLEARGITRWKQDN